MFITNLNHSKMVDKIRTKLAQQAKPIKLWVGTFNMAYKDIWNKDYKKSYKTLSELIPDGYDMYVLGV